MAESKRPILTVLIILGGIALFLGVLMMIVLRLGRPTANLSFADRVGVIPLQGAIFESQSIISQLTDFRENNRIKAIILRIDSPGGAVGPTQEIYREIRKTVKTKKVVASLGGVAASGGYYVAAAADRIVANPGTITGSIGVLMEFLRFEDLLDKIGVRMEVLKSGEFKDIGSPHRELTKRDREIIDALIADIQGQFVESVAEGRGLPLEAVSRIADGRVFSGARAKELQLVDMLGNFQDAVDVAKEMSGIKGEAELVYPKKGKMKLWETLLEGSARSIFRAIQEMTPHYCYQWKGF